MKGFDVLKIKPAVRRLNPMSYHFSHLTTMEIGQVVPLGVIDMVPRDEFNKIHARVFSRLAPLVKPTYGNIKFKTVSAFVPYHMVAADAEAWLDGKTVWEGYTPTDRYITIENFAKLFASYANTGMATIVGATQANCDFTYIASNGSRVYCLFTPKGKYVIKVLNSLGYSLPSGIDLQTGSSFLTQVGVKHLSAYPLLCFLKLYNDYMSQSQRFNTSMLSNILNAIKYGKAYSGMWNNATGEILLGGILAMVNSVLVNYENDYFTSAWQSPNAPLASVENISSINVPSSDEVIFEDTTDNKLTISADNVVSGRALDFLRSFTEWVKRNNYSGSRVVQQIFSRFGIKTSDYTDHYSEVISVKEFPVQVGDVTATADSSGVPLGAYAGKGLLSAEFDVSYKAKDYGLFLILGFITVVPMMSYGFDRRVLRVNPLDYYQPEFDGLGADAISVGEVYADPIDETASVFDNSTFGFTERYNSYRYMRDVISGDFRNYHADADMNVWHMGRNLSAVRAAGQLLAQNSAFNTLPQTDSEYNRIFTVTQSVVDHFYFTCVFDIDSKRPMQSLNQVAGLGEGDLVVPRNGNTIS